MLEPVYLRRADWAKVKVALEARLAASQDPVERRDLLTRLATLHEEQLEDYAAALETVAKLLHEDLSDEGVWAELERLAKVASAERRLAEIYATELRRSPPTTRSSAKLSRPHRRDLRTPRRGRRARSAGTGAPTSSSPSRAELFSAIDALLVKEARHAERVALYRASLDYRDDDDRLAALHTIARLERVELEEPDKAIDTYRAALDVRDTDAKALDALTELYTELGRDRDLADLLPAPRRVGAANGEEAAPYRLALARLLRAKLERHRRRDRSARGHRLRGAVERRRHQGAGGSSPTTPPTRRGSVEILRPLYERQDDWRLLIKLNEERFGLAEDAREKVAVLRETARLLGDERQRRAARLRGDCAPPSSWIPRTARPAPSWSGSPRRSAPGTSWPQSYEKGIATASDDLTRRELLNLLAKVYDARIDHPRKALDAYARLSALDPTEPDPLESMDSLAVLLADWRTVIAVLEKKSAIASDDENAAIWRRIAQTKLDMLEDVPGAVAAFEQALELDPESAATVDALIALYTPEANAKRLVELFARRVELVRPAGEADLRYDLNVRAAECYEKQLGDRREAIVALGAALDARPGDKVVLASLERLYRAEELWDELLGNLQLQAGAAETKEERVKLRTAIGDLYAGKLESPSDALEQYRLVLQDDAENDHAIAAARTIGETREELRLDAADILEPVLRAGNKHEALVAVLELRLKAQTEPTDRARTLRAIAAIEDEGRGRPAEAEAALLRALEDTPEDASLHEDIEKMSVRSEGSRRYADALATRAGAIYDATVAKDLYVRLGRVAEEKLGDDRRAVEAYAKAVEHAGDTAELLSALDRLHGRLGDQKALADVLERRVPLADTDKERADLLHRLAVIQNRVLRRQVAGPLDAPPGAGEGARSRRRVQGAGGAHRHARALRGGRRGARARLQDARRPPRPGPPLREANRPRGDGRRARPAAPRPRQGAGGALLRPEGRAGSARGGVRGRPDRRRRARRDRAPRAHHGRVEEREPRARSGHPEGRYLAHSGSETARDLWMRIAGWRKEKMGDSTGAEHAYEEALKHDPQSDFILREIEVLQRSPGRERELVETLRRLAALDGLQGSPADLRREAKALAEDRPRGRRPRRGHPPRDDRGGRQRRLGAGRAAPSCARRRAITRRSSASS